MNLVESADVAALCRHVASARGRPLHLLDIRQRGPGPTGLWVATEKADYIFYSDLATALHRGHIILHEIGHMVLDHRVSAALTEATAELLVPNLNPDVVRRTLSRSNYSAIEEREAEIFASLLMPKVDTLPAGTVEPAVPDSVMATLRRFAVVFGFDEDSRDV